MDGKLKKIFEKLEKDNIICELSEEDGEKTYTLEVLVSVPPYILGKKETSKAQEIAERHGVEFYHREFQVGEGTHREPRAVYGIECPEDKIEESAEKLKAARQDRLK